MKPIPPTAMTRSDAARVGFKTSIIALFVVIVLVIGLTLVYLSGSVAVRFGHDRTSYVNWSVGSAGIA